MKRFLRFILYAVCAILLLVVIGVAYIILAFPNVGPPEAIRIKLTPQRVARGEYLANHVSLCMDCHSRRNWSLFAGPLLPGGHGAGGQVFDAKIGFPGSVISPNITPYNLKNWTDGEIFRAITSGVGKDGSAIFPLMPWPYYAKMNREDLYDIVAYVRTLKSAGGSYPKSTLNFPLNVLVHTMPQKPELSLLPSIADTVKYGAYLVQAAGCADCHSQSKNGKLIAGLEFAGGHEYTTATNKVYSANITPDKLTGIGNWTQTFFVQRFKAYNDISKAVPVAKQGFQTIMPWYDYSGMTDADLKAVYKFLKTLKPVNNLVIKVAPDAIAANKQ